MISLDPYQRIRRIVRRFSHNRHRKWVTVAGTHILVTRDGKMARFSLLTNDPLFPLIVQINYMGKWLDFSFTLRGKYGQTGKSNHDLFLIPITQLENLTE